jgi:hypothetical protein
MNLMAWGRWEGVARGRHMAGAMKDLSWLLLSTRVLHWHPIRGQDHLFLFQLVFFNFHIFLFAKG